jgi:hypothetical protein
MLATIENRPVPGYVHNPLPDRYPTRESWPKIGTKGTHKGRPVELMDIWHAYRAVFKTGPYSTMAADLQDFIPCE